MKFILLLLIPFLSFADDSVSLSYSRINHDLKFEHPIYYKIDAVELAYSHENKITKNLYWQNRLSVKRSTETPNSVYMEDYLTYRLKFGYTVKTGLKYNFTDKFSVSTLTGLCEYRSELKVNDERVSWSDNVNSYKWCYSTHIYYKIDSNFLFEFSTGLDYKSYKKGFGNKRTDSINFGIAWVY